MRVVFLQLCIYFIITTNIVVQEKKKFQNSKNSSNLLCRTLVVSVDISERRPLHMRLWNFL